MSSNKFNSLKTFFYNFPDYASDRRHHLFKSDCSIFICADMTSPTHSKMDFEHSNFKWTRSIDWSICRIKKIFQPQNH